MPNRLILGPSFSDHPYWFAAGATVLLVAVLIVLRDKDRATRTITGVGLQMLVAASLFNIATFWNIWQPNEYPFKAVPLHARSLTMYLASIFIALGLGRFVVSRVFRMAALRRITVGMRVALVWAFVTTWLIVTGWASYIASEARDPGWPVTGNSNWQDQSVGWEGLPAESCVALDPWAWGSYGDGCRVVTWTNPWGFNATSEQVGLVDLEDLQAIYPSGRLSGVAFALHGPVGDMVHYQLTFHLIKPTQEIIFDGTVAAKPTANTVFTGLPESLPVARVQSISVSVVNGGLYTEGSNASGTEVLSFLTVDPR